jgi:hypothetical protein
MFNLTAGLQGLQQIGDRFTQLRDELELSIEETIRAERVGGLPGERGGQQQRGGDGDSAASLRRVAAGWNRVFVLCLNCSVLFQ